MPGFFATKGGKVPEPKNYDDSRCFQGRMDVDGWVVKWNMLDKFREDKIIYQNDRYAILLDGVILNKLELTALSGRQTWEETVLAMLEADSIFFKSFRGAFAGAVYDKRKGFWTCFTDQTGNHILLTYSDGKHVAFGTQLNYISDWMRLNGIKREISKNWVNDFFSYGYMLDTHTIIDGAARIYPGCYTIVQEGAIEEHCYYKVVKSDSRKTEEEWISLLDEAFSRCIKRMMDKCSEYGYKAAVDISGGLDSRMILTALEHQAEEMNPSLLGITYAQTGSADDRIARSVAQRAGIDYLFYGMDGGECLKDIDDLVFMNQGFNYYAGITGGGKMLQLLDRKQYGMEFWGILGDIYEGAMITEEDISQPQWDYPRFATSARFQNRHTQGYRDYQDNELLWFYVRGMLCGQNTALIRQNFLEAAPPYGDVEFMDLIFSIPYEVRTKGHIYRKWMCRKYPEMARIPYSHTGVRVTETDAWERRLRFPVRVRNKLYRTFGSKHYERIRSMNPIDYWMKTNPSLSKCFRNYYEENIPVLDAYGDLRDRTERLYEEGKAGGMDIIMALTAISAVKQFIV